MFEIKLVIGIIFNASPTQSAANQAHTVCADNMDVSSMQKIFLRLFYSFVGLNQLCLFFSDNDTDSHELYPQTNDYCAHSQVHIVCPIALVIIIKHAVYGDLAGDRCLVGEVGCNVTVTSRLARECDGRKECDPDVDDIGRNRPEKCLSRNAYILATHDCVPSKKGQISRNHCPHVYTTNTCQQDMTWPHFYQTRSAWSVDQGSNKKHSPAYNFAPTVNKFCVMWEGLSLPHGTKFGNCRCKIVDSRAFPSWSLIHGLRWSGLIKAEPGLGSSTSSSWYLLFVNYLGKLLHYSLYVCLHIC